MRKNSRIYQNHKIIKKLPKMVILHWFLQNMLKTSPDPPIGNYPFISYPLMDLDCPFPKKIIAGATGFYSIFHYLCREFCQNRLYFYRTLFRIEEICLNFENFLLISAKFSLKNVEKCGKIFPIFWNLRGNFSKIVSPKIFDKFSGDPYAAIPTNLWPLSACRNRKSTNNSRLRSLIMLIFQNFIYSTM